jgi:polygalacturonase
MLEEKFKENYWMFINLFEYANKLLEGGNVKAQHSFYDIFLRDHKNVTFENIKIIIENSTMGLKFFFHSYPKLEDSRLSSQDDIIYPENRNI